jgi:hypothetical protein
VAVNFCEVVALTLAVAGAMITLSGRAVRAIATVEDLVLSETDVAVRLTLAGLGSDAGAV